MNQNSKFARALFTLKEGGEVRLGGLTLLSVDTVGEPFLKVTVSVQILKGEECCLFDHNKNDWSPVDTEAIVVGLGDKLIVGTTQIMVTSISKRYGEARFSVQSNDEETSKLIRNYKESLK